MYPESNTLPKQPYPDRSAAGLVDLISLHEKEWRRVRGTQIAMIFQNPSQALNHSRTIGSQFIETIRAHRPLAKKDSAALARSMLISVQLENPDRIMKSYPFELSGGMCQRVLIAFALVHNPLLLIADEPTSSLDTISRREILRLFAHIHEKYHTAILLVSHDEDVINSVCERRITWRTGPVSRFHWSP
jgi:ABC-type dipeptide/oligopeptide/nickel transport system ATPase component